MNDTPKSPTEKQKQALVALSKGEKVPNPMLERLAAHGWVKLTKEQRMSGRGGMPSVWYVTTGGTLTSKGAALV